MLDNQAGGEDGEGVLWVQTQELGSEDASGKGFLGGQP